MSSSTDPLIDRPAQARSGELPDQEKLTRFLEQTFPQWGSLQDILQYPAGYSNLTYCLVFPDREVVLRRPPAGARVHRGHDMEREHRILKLLHPLFPKVPKVFGYFEDNDVLDAPFFLMERVEGIIVRKRMSGYEKLAPLDYTAIATAWIDTLTDLHQLEISGTPLATIGKPEGYIDRQLRGWAERYRKARTAEVSSTEKLIKWLFRQKVRPSGKSLVHNDYKYDNILFSSGDWSRVRAVLDWELATIGDPMLDFGTSMAYWTTADDHPFELEFTSLPTFLPGNPDRVELLDRYGKATGKATGNFLFHYAFGLFKVAVIAQQIFYRYSKGLTQDPRFAALGQVAELLTTKALLAIEKGRMDRLY